MAKKKKNIMELGKICEDQLSQPTRHERGKVLLLSLCSDDGPNVTVNKTEDYSCGKGNLVMNDVITLFPQMKNDGLY